MKRTNRRAPRLQFTDEERADPVLEKPIRKTETAQKRLDRVRLHFDEDKPKPPSKFSHHTAQTAISNKLHREIRDSNEDDNAGVETADRAVQSAEFTQRRAESAYHSHKLKPYRESAQAEKQLDKANINYLQQKAARDNPHTASNPLSRWQQKQAIKKQYAAAKAGKTAKTTKKAAKTTKKTAEKAAEATEKTAAFIWRHKVGFLIAGGVVLLIVLIFNLFSSCSAMVQGGVGAIASTTYPSEDETVLAVEGEYVGLETALERELDSIESAHPGYDEYRYDTDEIGHEPYALISYLTARFHDLEDAGISAELQSLFDQQYTLTLTPVTETRYREETSIDPETGESVTETVAYQYHILNVTLRNKELAAITAARMDTEQAELYSVLLACKGNRPYLFSAEDNPYVGEITPPEPYEIPPEALSDPAFAALIREAEKYLGYPYVWGGSKPSTSFDCSGFVCWVLNQSGTASVGRTNARGLYKTSTVVSRADAQPGDLIFFTGKRAAEIGHPVTHVGIYVGNGMMLHCAGNGVEYHTIDSPYYSRNFYAFGRL